MARRIPNVERPSARRDVRTLPQHLQVRLGYWNHLPPQPRDALDSPELIGAIYQLRGIDDVRRSLLVHEHPYPRVVAHQQTSGSSVIKMDVRNEDRLDVANADSLRHQRRPERVDARARARVDQHCPRLTCVHTGGNRLWRVAEVQIDIGDV